MSGADSTDEIEVVYEDGVFKPLKKISLSEGTKAIVTIKPESILDIARRYRTKVDTDVMKEFIAERR